MIDRIMSDIRQRADRRTAEKAASFDPGVFRRRAGLAGQTARLTALDEAIMAAARSVGVCPAGPSSFRARLGRFAIGVMSRLFWWHHARIQDLASRIVARNREQSEQFAAFERTVAESLDGNLAVTEAKWNLAQLRAEIVAYKTQVRVVQQESEERLRQLEAAQISLQSAQLGTATTAEFQSLTERLAALESSVAALAEQLTRLAEKAESRS